MTNETYNINLDSLIFDSPILHAVAEVARRSGMDPQHPDVLRVMIHQLHQRVKHLETEAARDASMLRTYELMTNGIRVNGKRFVFVPPSSQKDDSDA